MSDVWRLARPILARLQLLMHGTTQSLGPVTRARGTPEHNRPPGEIKPPHEVFAERIRAAASADEALRVVIEARKALKNATRRTMMVTSFETADELAERIRADGEGWAVKDVAMAMRCTPTFVRRARLESDRDPETGYSVPDAEDVMAVAQQLREGGRSYRVIAQLTGIPRSTLHDRLN